MIHNWWNSTLPSIFFYLNDLRKWLLFFDLNWTLSYLLKTANGGGWGAKTGLYTIPVLTPDRIKKIQNGRRFKEDGDPAFTLTVQDKHGIFDGKRIRRLTPKECERLQGFKDDYTEGISDSQRYKCLGNAVSIPVVQHIMSKISITDELKCIDN